MSFKIKRVNKNDLKEEKQFSKEEKELKKLIENIDDSSLPFSLTQ